MSDFTTTPEAGQSQDPLKRTNHVLGLVMGADEFQQDMLHLRERDHLGVRALHGYGTVAGLSVIGNNENDQLEVRPGLAVDPVGRFICVPEPQCATVDDWLNAHRTEVEAETGPLGSPPQDLDLYVVLCYRECLTDDVPLPAAECLSAEESSVASRIAESFELKILLEPPEPVGEVAAPESLSGLTLEGLVEFLWQTVASFPDSLPPGSLPEFEVVKDEILNWVISERPELGKGLPCLGVEGDPCVLIARVAIQVELQLTPGGDTLAMVGDPEVDYEDRPILLSTRFLQELLIRFAAASEEWRELALGDLVDVDLPAPSDDEVLTYQGGVWVAAPVVAAGPPIGPAGGDLGGTYPDPTVRRLRGRPMVGNVTPGEALLFEAGGGGRWRAGPVISPGDAAGGDLDGTYPDPQVDGLQGRPVADAAPDTGDVLTWNGSVWRPAAAAGGGAPSGPAGGDLDGTYPNPEVDGIIGFPVELPSPPVPPNDGDTLIFNAGIWTVAPPPRPPAPPAIPEVVLPFATITQLDDLDFPMAYAIWFHIDAHDNDWEVLPDALGDELDPGALEVFSEVGSGNNLSLVGPNRVIRQNRRNVFIAEVESGAPLLRFRFRLDGIGVRSRDGSENSLADYAWGENSITFVGQEIGEATVTKFVRNVTSRAWVGTANPVFDLGNLG